MERLRHPFYFRFARAEAIEVRPIEDIDRLVHCVLQRVRSTGVSEYPGKVQHRALDVEKATRRICFALGLRVSAYEPNREFALSLEAAVQIENMILAFRTTASHI
jgi:hypothetical protein